MAAPGGFVIPGGLGEVKVGKGNHWSAPTRQLIVHFVKNLQAEYDEIVRAVFVGQEPNEHYLRRKMREIGSMTDAELTEYIMGPLKRGGNKRKLDLASHNELMTLRRLQNQLRLLPLARLFNEAHYDYPQLDGISPSTVCRTLKRSNETRKKATIIPLAANPVDQLNFLDDIAHVHELDLVDVDENSVARDKLREEYAYSLQGTPAPVPQNAINILGFSFSIISAYTPFGFLCWRAYEGSISSLEVEDFIRYGAKSHFLFSSLHSSPPSISLLTNHVKTYNRQELSPLLTT